VKFDRAFRLYNYLLLLAGFFSLFASGAVGLTLAAGYLLALLLAWWLPVMKLPAVTQLALVLLLIGCFFVDVFFFSTFVEALVHLLLLVSLVKLFSAVTTRDYLLLYLISFVFILLASSFTISIFFLVTLATWVFFSILAFMMLETREAYSQTRKVTFSHAAYLQMSLLVTLLVMLFAIPIFVVIPRGGVSLLRVGSDPVLMAGFSDRVALGEIGRIMTDGRVVMRVKTDHPPDEIPADIKWRGIALDNYDQSTWTNTRRSEQKIYQIQHEMGLLVPRMRRQDENQLRQTYILEPFTNIVFGAPDIILISGPTTGRSFSFIVEDGNNSFTFLPGPSRRLSYVVDSDIVSRHQRLIAALKTTAQTSEAMPHYLQLPALHPRIGRLAAEIASTRRTPVEKALTIERFLTRNYRYTLDNESAHAPDPLMSFLFETRAGHCEYFATAQAVLMRAVGIPSRVVNGFRRGEYNNWNGHFVVRQSDAHSWVEGYFDGVGWIEFDPTPPDLHPDRFILAQWSSQWLDALDAFWTEVITFDRIQQVGLFQAAGKQLVQSVLQLGTITQWAEGIREKYRERLAGVRLPDLVPYLWWFTAFILVGGMLYRYRRYLRLFVRRTILGQSPDRLAPEYYREMLQLLNKRGFVRKVSETPLEFVTRISSELENPIPFQLTTIYYHNRFGNFPLEESQLSQIYAGLRELRKALSGRLARHPRPPE
jgi:protein-glutamine gamma-glutamyltransferase